MIATNVICKTVTAQTSLRFIVQLRQNDVNTVSYFLVWRLYCLIRSSATVVPVCVTAKPRNGAQRRTTAHNGAVVPLCAVAWFLQTDRVTVRVRVRFRDSVKFRNLHNYVSDK